MHIAESRRSPASTHIIRIPHDSEYNAFAGEGIVEALPPRDLLIKPVDGRGGQDIERWDFIGRGQFVGADGKRYPVMN